MQLQQRHSTTDFLGLAQSCVPIQPSADHPRQNPSGNSGLFIQGLLNAFENIGAKFLTADRHTGSLEDQYSLCPAKNVGHVQSFRKGRMSTFVFAQLLIKRARSDGPSNSSPVR